MYVRGGLPGVPGADAVMTVAWRKGPDMAMQKARIYMRGWVFPMTGGAGVTTLRSSGLRCVVESRRPIKRSAIGKIVRRDGERHLYWARGGTLVAKPRPPKYS
jgi:hypothetical protein